MSAPDVEQKGKIDPIAVVVAQGESTLVAAYRHVQVSRVFRLLEVVFLPKSITTKQVPVGCLEFSVGTLMASLFRE